jgi:hypothetical protein
MAQKTTSTHRSAFVQATHRFDILGYSTLKSLGVRTTVRSGSFDAGGLPWTLVCCFDEIPKPGGVVQLASISLELSKSETRVQVVAMAGLRIDEAAGTGQFPAAVWQSARAKTFGAWQRDAVAWELGVPTAFRDQEARYVDADVDRLTIHCTVDVLKKDAAAVAVSDCFVSVPPPPSIALDFHRLLKGRCLPARDTVLGLPRRVLPRGHEGAEHAAHQDRRHGRLDLEGHARLHLHRRAA